MNQERVNTLIARYAGACYHPLVNSATVMLAFISIALVVEHTLLPHLLRPNGSAVQTAAVSGASAGLLAAAALAAVLIDSSGEPVSRLFVSLFRSEPQTLPAWTLIALLSIPAAILACSRPRIASHLSVPTLLSDRFGSRSMVIALSVFSAVIVEIVYRGFLFRLLSYESSQLHAAVVVSAVYVLAQLPRGRAHTVAALIAAPALAMLVIFSSSVIPALVAHVGAVVGAQITVAAMVDRNRWDLRKPRDAGSRTDESP